MVYVEVNNVDYACRIYHSDEHLPYLLMLHGFMGDHRVFNHLMDDLRKFCNPVAVDLLGFGSSAKPSDAERYREEKQVRDIISLVNKLQLKNLFLYGYSMGGRLALKTALEAPELFKGFIFESTNCGISDPEERKNRQQLDQRWAAEIEDDLSKFLEGWKELDLFQYSGTRNESLFENYHQIQSEQNPTALAASLHGFGTGSMNPVCHRLTKLEKNVLLMAGSEDEKYQQINHFMVTEFPDAKLESIPAGHRTHLDNPSTFLNTVRNFISKNRSLNSPFEGGAA